MSVNFQRIFGFKNSNPMSCDQSTIFPFLGSVLTHIYIYVPHRHRHIYRHGHGYRHGHRHGHKQRERETHSMLHNMCATDSPLPSASLSASLLPREGAEPFELILFVLLTISSCCTHPPCVYIVFILPTSSPTTNSHAPVFMTTAVEPGHPLLEAGRATSGT